MIHQNALIALAAAAAWGGGDFSGGMGVKATSGRVSDAIRFVVLAHAISLAAMMALLWAGHAAMPHGAPMLWAMAAGVTGALGIVAFYRALSRGGMGVSAAVSGLLAAAIPALVSSLLEGAPQGLRLAGFALAGAAIWLIAAGDSPENQPPKTRAESSGTRALATVAGVAFGLYFVALKMANPLGLVMPMAIARVSSVTFCALALGGMALTASLKKDGAPDKAPRGTARANWLLAWGWACAVALLDTGGNLLFMEATRLGRLDVASVLASLYPAGTILLAAWALHERPTRRQGLGMLAALAAVVMITL